MKVKDLIEKLEKIEDKDKMVCIGIDKETTGEFDVVEMGILVCLFDY
jgi:hypothetical protein